MTIIIDLSTPEKCDAFLNFAPSVGGIAELSATARRVNDATRDYRHVSRYSEVDCEQQRDFINHRAMKEAILKDAAEPATHKAWREVLSIHGRIVGALNHLWCIKRAEGRGYVAASAPRVWCGARPGRGSYARIRGRWRDR